MDNIKVKYRYLCCFIAFFAIQWLLYVLFPFATDLTVLAFKTCLLAALTTTLVYLYDRIIKRYQNMPQYDPKKRRILGYAALITIVVVFQAGLSLIEPSTQTNLGFAKFAVGTIVQLIILISLVYLYERYHARVIGKN